MSGPLRKKWTLVKPTLRDLIVLCANMRPDEIEQYLAFHEVDGWDFEQAAHHFYGLPGVSFTVLGPDQEPLVAGGYIRMHGNVWRSWMCGTMETWGAHWRSITEASRFVMDCLMEDGATRLETLVLEKRELTCRWYEKGLKLEREGVLRGYGVRGENAVTYSRFVPRTTQQVEEVRHGVIG